MRIPWHFPAGITTIALAFASCAIAAESGYRPAAVREVQAAYGPGSWSAGRLPGRLDLRLHDRISPGIPGDDERWLGQNPGYPPWYIWPGPEFGAPVERYNYGAPYYTHPPYYGYQPGVADYYNYSYGLPPPVPQYGPNYDFDLD